MYKLIVNIVNEDEINEYIESYKERFPNTYSSLDDIKNMIADMYNNFDNDDYEQFYVPVCSDWDSKLYGFKLVDVFDRDPTCLRLEYYFNDIYKL